VYLFLGVVVFVIVLIGFSETSWFKGILRDTIVDAADSALYAKLSIDRIDGNLFSGWALRGVRLRDEHGTIASIDAVLLRYELLGLMWKRITVKELTLSKPEIFITRAAGRDWNIDRMLRPSEDTDTSASTFDWRIVVENLRIVDGRFVRYDSSLAGEVPRTRLDAQRMDMREINLALRADIRPNDKRVSFNQLRASNALGDVSLVNLSGDIDIRPDGVAVQGLSLQTERSAIILTAAVDSVDVLGGFDTETMADWPMAVRARAPMVDARDLRYFLSSLDFMDGVARVELSAKGSLRRLQVRTVGIEAYDSRIAFSGELRDILEGTDMWMDVRATEARIVGADAMRLLPGIPMLDVRGLGTANFGTLRYTGKPLVFEAEMDVRTDAGSVAGTVQFDFSGEEFLYDGGFTSRGVDLSRVLLQPALSSSITAQGSIKGRGTTLGSMAAVMSLRVDSSRYQGVRISRLSGDVTVRPDSMDVDVRLESSAGELTVDGGMSFLPDSITGFRVESRAKALNLAPLLADEEMRSDLSFHLRAQGDGVDLSRASLDIAVAVEPSRFADIALERDTFRVVLQQQDASKELLLLESQYADARIEGSFDLPRFLGWAGEQSDSLMANLARYGLRSDTLSTGGDATHTAQRGNGRSQRIRAAQPPISLDTAAFMNATYAITLKHPERIARYFDASTFIIRGTYSGSIAGGRNGFDISGQLRVSDFYYIDSVRSWLAAGMRFNYDIHDLRLDAPLDHVSLRAVASASDVSVNGLRLRRIEAMLQWADKQPRLRLRGGLDTLAEVALDAEGTLEDGALAIRMPQLDVSWRGERFRNTGDVRVRIDSSGYDIESMALVHDRARLSVEGRRSHEGVNDFSMYVDSIAVGTLEFAATGDPVALRGESFTGTSFIEANVRGTDDDPRIAAAVYVDNLGYKGSAFGELNMEARYEAQRLELYSELEYQDGDGTAEKVFFLSGTIPVAFGADSSRIAAGATANLRAQMRDFPLALLEEFIGLFSPLQGTINADVSITGTAATPSFDGYIHVSDARGRFLFNNMDYLFGIKVEAEKQDIRIADAWIANDPADWTDGRITATGTITTREFAIANFDLAMRGRLKVLRGASRAATRSLYGDLYISTGSEDLTYRGRLDRSLLVGAVVVENGALVFPLETESSVVSDYRDITYVVVDDTTTQLTSSLSGGRGLRPGMLPAAEAALPERSVLDGLTFDMTISTSGRLRVEIPFSVLQEELNATLSFDALKVNNWGGQNKFVGEVKLEDESWLVFFGKRLTASGLLRFTRDPQNPDLDLKAIYSDYYTDPRTDVRRKIFVTIYVTGTKNKPELRYDMRWDDADGPPVSSGGDIESDAFSFVALGVFAKDLSSTEGGRNVLGDRTPQLANALLSPLASSAATQFVEKAGLRDIIKRVDFSDLSTQDRRVKLTSEIGQSIISYDGKINNLESSNVSIDFPLSRMLGIPWVNLVIQISRKTIDQTLQSGTQAQEYSIYELRILQRFSF